MPSKNYDTLIASIAGFLIIYAFSLHGGIGVTPDSVVYISTADNILHHGRINDFSGTPVMDFPAFYPIFLSTFLFLTGKPLMSFGAVLNGLLFGLLIYLCGWLMERFSFRSKWYKWILLSFIVLSPCLLEVYSMIWSETLFILLLVCFILFSRRYFLTHSITYLLLIGVITSLACVTRYAGITFIGTAGLLILCDNSLKIKKKLGHILIYTAVSCCCLILNLIRNRMVTGTLTGYREKAITSFSANLHDFGTVFCDWLPFFNNHYGLAPLVGLFWILFFIAAFLYRLFRKVRFFSFENIATTYFIVYSIFILFTASVSRFQQLDSRLLSPLFIPWIWGGTCWIPTWMAGRTVNRRRLILFASALAALCFQTGQLTADYETWDGVRSAGIPGYTEDQWTLSPTVSFVREHKDMLHNKSTLYTNAYEGIWFLTGQQADMIPHKEFLKDIQEFLAEDHFYVVWFNDSQNSDFIDMNFISRYKKLSKLYTFDDGAVYYFTTDPTLPKY